VAVKPSSASTGSVTLERQNVATPAYAVSGCRQKNASLCACERRGESARQPQSTPAAAVAAAVVAAAAAAVRARCALSPAVGDRELALELRVPALDLLEAHYVCVL
jgi:hypothetical protein